MFTRFKQNLISFVYQPSCCFCDSEIESTADAYSNFVLCEGCYSETANSGSPHCYFCGAEKSRLNPFGSRCASCREWKSKFERAIAIGNYRDPLKNAIIEIKRQSNETKAYQIGVILAGIVEKTEVLGSIDLVVPVPSHWRRRFSRRGLHVAGVIAEGFCRETGLPLKENALKCVRHTGKQSKLRPGQRINNVKGAFCSQNRRKLSGANILLIDDVMTSGATVNECTNVLLRARARSVFVAVGARGVGVS